MEDPLKFGFEEHPSWRSPDKKIATSEMLREIAELTDRYKILPEEAHEFSRNLFARAMAVDYVYNSNVGEHVGTQTMDETETLLERLFDEELQESDKSKERMETINTYKAMGAIYEFHKEMNKTGMLTVQQVCDVHKVLLKGLPKCGGEIRRSEVCTYCQNGPHYYPSPEKAEQLFYYAIDHHNIHMEALQSGSVVTTTREMVEYLVKCAAWLLFKFVDAHPFLDGNGRMCRLLANYVLSVITPFPVALYHTCRSNSRSDRQNYIDAIEECRYHPEQRPCKIATMLVEGAWWGWTGLFQNLEQLKLLESTKIYGPIAIQKSKTQQVKERVAQVFRKKPGVNVEDITEKLIGETKTVEVVDLKPYQCIERTIQVGETRVAAKIFP